MENDTCLIFLLYMGQRNILEIDYKGQTERIDEINSNAKLTY